MSKTQILLLAGFGAGAASMLLMFPLLGKLGPADAEWTAERERLLGQITHLEAQQPRKRGTSPRSLLGRGERPGPQQEASDGTGGAGKAVDGKETLEDADWEEQQRAAAVNRLLNSLASYVELDDAGLEAARQILEKKLTLPADQGPGPAIEFGNPGTREDAALSKLRETLSPEQQAGVDALLEARRENRIESRAHSELAALQSQFLLTEDQRAAAYEVFSDLARAAVEEENGWNLKAMPQDQAQKAEALAEVLTPEQFELYLQINGDLWLGPTAIRIEAVVPPPVGTSSSEPEGK